MHRIIIALAAVVTLGSTASSQAADTLPKTVFELNQAIPLTNDFTVTVALKKAGATTENFGIGSSKGRTIEAGYDIELRFENKADLPFKHSVIAGAESSNIFIVEESGTKRFPVALAGRKGFSGKDSHERSWRHVLTEGGTALLDEGDGGPVGIRGKDGKHIGVIVILSTAKGDTDWVVVRFPSIVETQGAKLHIANPQTKSVIVVNLPKN